MTEKLQTRTEHSRSMEDAERLRAIHTLQELGLLIPLSQIDTFHGRAKSSADTKEWQVDPSFRNGGNDSGNDNVYQRPVVYTSDRATAEEFADTRMGVMRARGILSHFEEEVRHYSDDERQDWLSRLNEQQGNSTSFAPDDLDYPNFITREAIRLRDLQRDEATHVATLVDAQTDIHDISSSDNDASVIDSHFNLSELSEEDTVRYYTALSKLVLKASEGSPLAFESRELSPEISRAILEKKKTYINDQEVQEMAEEYHIDVTTLRQMVGAYNATNAMRFDPLFLTRKILTHTNVLQNEAHEVEGQIVEIPINYEYVERYLRQAHIVGMKGGMYSATVGRYIDAVSLFDLEKVDSTDSIERRRSHIQQKLGDIANQFSEFDPNNPSSVLARLAEPYTSPGSVVGLGRNVEGYDNVFDADTGNWEGFTLAQHTETVLHNFDENFADNLPVGLIGPMRLAILVHDLGKPEAAENHDLRHQKQYNLRAAEDFLRKIGTSKKLTNLILALIGDGEELAASVHLHKTGGSAERQLEDFSRTALSDFYDGNTVDDQLVEGFVEMCKMLQICDGGAYTSMATTRTSAGSTYRNAPSFNGTFAEPVGFGKRDIRLKDN